MGDFTIGVMAGFIATISLFTYLEFTPRVSYTDTLRAVQVCKGGKWESISDENITCSDGAKYKLEQEDK